MATARLLALAMAPLLGLLVQGALPRSAFAQNEAAQHSGENGASNGSVKATITYSSDLLWNTEGGIQPGAMYWGRLGLLLDSDLGEAVGWQGASAHLSLHALHGVGLSGDRVGNVMTVSGLAAEPNLRLFNIWVEQRLGPRATLRVGQFTAAQEFMVGPTANLFVNSTFGWPASFAADLPSGGPAFPIAAPGVRLSLTPNAATTLMAAVFPGDPAGAGAGDPQRRDAFGLNSFRLKGGPFVIAEAGWQARGATVKLGGWADFDQFADVRPASPGAPVREHRDNFALYGILDAPLWTASGDPQRVLHGFLRASVSPSDRNRVDRYLDAGFSLAAPFSGRPSDTAGLSLAYAGLPASGHEVVIEATYQAQLTTVLALQPDLQVVLRPNGAALDNEGRSRTALVAGLRTQLRF